MELAAGGVKTLLVAPAVKCLVQEGVGTLHLGLDANGGAVGHVQLNQGAATLEQVQLLGADVGVGIADALLAETLEHEAVVVVVNAEADVVNAEADAQNRNEQSGKQHQTLAFLKIGDQHQGSQYAQQHAGDAVDLGQADGKSAAVLLLAAKQAGEALVNEKQHAEGQCGSENHFHGKSPF